MTLVALALATAGWSQGAGSPKQFPVPGHGRLQVVVPSGWSVETREAAREKGLPATFLFTPGSGPAFRLLLTPLGSPTGETGFNTPAWIQAQITHIRDLRLQVAAQKEAPLHEIRSKSGTGYWFSVKDPAPKPGEYEYLTQGALPAGDLCVSFTVLTHVAPPEGIADALALLATAEQVK